MFQSAITWFYGKYIFSFIRYSHTLFHSGYNILHFYTNNVGVIEFLLNLARIWCWKHFLTLRHHNMFLVMTHCGFNLCFFNGKLWQTSFMCLFATCTERFIPTGLGQLLYWVTMGAFDIKGTHEYHCSPTSPASHHFVLFWCQMNVESQLPTGVFWHQWKTGEL